MNSEQRTSSYSLCN